MTDPRGIDAVKQKPPCGASRTGVSFWGSRRRARAMRAQDAPAARDKRADPDSAPEAKLARFARTVLRRTKNKTPQARAYGVLSNKSLTMTYFHRRPSTIIGAKAFHCPVRDGKEWYHLAMVVRRNGLRDCLWGQPLQSWKKRNVWRSECDSMINAQWV